MHLPMAVVGADQSVLFITAVLHQLQTVLIPTAVHPLSVIHAACSFRIDAGCPPLEILFLIALSSTAKFKQQTCSPCDDSSYQVQLTAIA